MKLLCLDFGNSLIKAATIESDEISDVYHLPYQPDDFQQIIPLLSKVQGVVYASVVEKARVSPFLSLLKAWPIYSLRDFSKIPFVNKYKTPDTLGEDRIALVAAASVMYRNRNVLIIDVGTCITYDILNQHNEYLGGVIAPGVRMRAWAMHTYTAQLPEIKENELWQCDDCFVGSSTIECMAAGAFTMARLEMERYIEHIQQIFPDITVIITGGEKRYFEKHLKNAIFAPENFLLRGIYEVARYNIT